LTRSSQKFPDLLQALLNISGENHTVLADINEFLPILTIFLVWYGWNWVQEFCK